jgi:3-deoxy-D-manno-octulosonate 8-phosphate phosphatase (KDO 8-P phosphatase)
MPKISSQARARRIKLLLFDVDGVLTDGKLYFLPSSADPTGRIEFKGFHAHDGAAISLAKLGGLKTGIITKRTSQTVAIRARDLKLDFVHQGVNDKKKCFDEVLAAAGVKPEEAAYVGDDVIDLPPMRDAGLAVAVKNARADVKREAHYMTPHAGGDGALRDAIEFILKAQGKWKRVVEKYIAGQDR